MPELSDTMRILLISGFSEIFPHSIIEATVEKFCRVALRTICTAHNFREKRHNVVVLRKWKTRSVAQDGRMDSSRLLHLQIKSHTALPRIECRCSLA
jgi:hypothetical protein